MNKVQYLHDTKEALLTNTILVFKQFVTWKGPSDVSTDRFLKWRSLFQIARVHLFLDTIHLNATQQLPHNASEWLWYTSPNQLLQQQFNSSTSGTTTQQLASSLLCLYSRLKTSTNNVQQILHQSGISIQWTWPKCGHKTTTTKLFITMLDANQLISCH